MDNMEKFKLVQKYWSESLGPMSKLERRLVTFIAFQDLLVERSMTEALSSPVSRKAKAAEVRHGGVVETLERLLGIMNTIQQRKRFSQ